VAGVHYLIDENLPLHVLSWKKDSARIAEADSTVAVLGNLKSKEE
jgi:hypothetical protein